MTGELMVSSNEVYESLQSQLTNIQDNILSIHIYEDDRAKLKLFDVLQRIESIKHDLMV